jgi:hypothetical protein
MPRSDRRTPKKGQRKPAPRPTAKAAAAPVTLAEARALARAARPLVTAKRMRKTAAKTATLATLGAERERLREQQREEIAAREREYRDTMAIMKQRGARAARPAPGAKSVAKSASKAHGFKPLQIVAEGDSWFDYPVPAFGGGIIPRLERRLGVPILQLAKAGDEVRYMLGVEERTLLTRHLRAGCPAGGPWDVLLFSGGGNDIVDNPMALWIRDFDSTQPPETRIHAERFAAALTLVRAGYEDLIALRDLWSPTTHIILHGYDFAIPDGRDVCFIGPWLKPTFDLRGFPNLTMRAAVVKAMLQRFAALLASIAAAANRVTVINTQGTLPPVKGSWHNELHPARQGFDQFADLFHRQIRALFPDRVA